MSLTSTEAHTNRHGIGDLVVAASPDEDPTGPVIGLITRMEWDKRWMIWYYGVDWNGGNDGFALLKFRDSDIDHFKRNLKDWCIIYG